MNKIATTVKNPSHRSGQSAYVECNHCKKFYTRLGISRHWDKCPMKKVEHEK